MAFDSERLTSTLVPTIKDVLLAPNEFFQGLQRTAYYKDSVLYILLLCLAGSIIGVPFASFSSLFLVPVFAFVWLMVLRLWAAYLAWAGKRFAQAKITPVNAFQLSAYAFTPLLLFYAVPYLDVAAGVWSFALCASGLIRFAQAKPESAWAVVGLPAFVIGIPALVATAKLFAFLPKLPALLGGRPA